MAQPADLWAHRVINNDGWFYTPGRPDHFNRSCDDCDLGIYRDCGRGCMVAGRPIEKVDGYMKSQMNQKIVVALLACASIGTTVLLLVLLSTADTKHTGRGVYQPVAHSDSTGLPVLRSLDDFQLIDSQGQPFGTAQLKGKLWVAGFVFTRCTGPCPAITSKMAQLQMEIEKQQIGDRVRLVSISVDPEHDRPKVLREYARIAMADPRVWTFLTGELDEVSAIVQNNFLLPLSISKGPIVHSQRLALIDPQGRLRGYYDALSPDGYKALQDDMASLLESNQSGIEQDTNAQIQQARR